MKHLVCIIFILSLLLTGCSITEKFYREDLYKEKEVRTKEKVYEPTPAQMARLFDITYDKFLWEPKDNVLFTVTCPKYFSRNFIISDQPQHTKTKFASIAPKDVIQLFDEENKQLSNYYTYTVVYVEAEDYPDYKKNYLNALLYDYFTSMLRFDDEQELSYTEYCKEVQDTLDSVLPEPGRQTTSAILTGNIEDVSGMLYIPEIDLSYFNADFGVLQLPYASIHYQLPSGDYFIVSVHDNVAGGLFEDTSYWETNLFGKDPNKKTLKALSDSVPEPVDYQDLLDNFMLTTMIGDWSKYFKSVPREIVAPTMEDITEQESTDEEVFGENSDEESESIGEEKPAQIVTSVPDEDDDYGYDGYGNGDDVYFE